jgi:hypothetical protein
MKSSWDSLIPFLPFLLDHLLLWSLELDPIPILVKSKSKLCYDWWSVGQFVLVSSTHLGLRTRFFSCLTVVVLLMWGALCDERMRLSFTMYSKFTFYMLLRECIYTIYTRLLSAILAAWGGPYGKHSLLLLKSVFTGSLLSSGRPVVPRVAFCGNVFSDPLPSNGHTHYNIIISPA